MWLPCSQTSGCLDSAAASVVPLGELLSRRPLFVSLFLGRLYLQEDIRSGIPSQPRGPADISPEIDPSSLPVPVPFSLETINCLCHHRIIIQHIPLGHHSMREEILSNILVAPTFNQL